MLLGAVGVAAGVAGALFGAFGVQRATGASDLLSLTLPDLDGRPTPLMGWQGRVLVANFWATWCAPCLEEIPLLATVQRQHAGRGLQVVGIALDQAPKIRDFVAKTPAGYPILVGDGSLVGLMQKLGNPSGGLPFTAILDRKGSLAHRKLGAFKGAELAGIIQPLLG
ncbi:MAG: TlpA family protein disulfide reductase [Betaproteobacteria bacterium]